MTYRTPVFAFIFCVMTLSSQAMAKEILNAKTLIKIAGLDQIFIEFPPIFSNDLEKMKKSGRKISPKFEKSWREATRKTLNSDRMILKMEKALSGQFTPAEQGILKNFLEGDLGHRLTAAEVKAQTKQKDIMHRLREIIAKGQKDRKRFALYQTIDNAIQGTKKGTDLALNVQLAGQIGLFASGQIKIPGQSLESLTLRISKTRPRLERVVHRFLIANMIETYRHISLQDMILYKNFLTSPAGSKFYKILNDSQERIIVQATMNFGQTLMTLIKSKDPI